ncbi:MAG: rhomboid family intramembrane serine protease [Chitinivibrionales bacterium]|nr:rhomboid family intramembrane serine protease [Chitinivibrionales bacterium]
MYNQSPYQLTQAVKVLLIVTTGIYCIELIPAVGPWCLNAGALYAPSVLTHGAWWQCVTYLFLHAPSFPPWHLLFNMLGLWMFGNALEQMWGSRQFTIFYFVVGIGSGMLSLLTVFFLKAPIIGASGAILGILTAYAYYFPHQQILLFFIIPVSVRLAVIIFGLISLLGAWSGYGGVAHLTHLGGILVALLYLRYYNQVTAFLSHIQALRAERRMRKVAARKIAADRYFEEVIDPILKKISEAGMNSLTKEELENLNKYSKKNNRN